MPFIPHTPDDVERHARRHRREDASKTCSTKFPKELRIESLAGIPDALNEMQTGRLMMARAAQDGMPLNFIGAGAYEHHIPVGGLGGRRRAASSTAPTRRTRPKPAGHAAAHLRIPDDDFAR